MDWLLERNAYLTPKEEIPEYGYVTFVNDIPTAMAFLRRVEGGYAQLDGLTSNPMQSSEARHQAIDLVVNRIKYQCKELEIKHLIAFSSDNSTLLRSKSHGFTSMGDHKVIVLSIP